MTNFKIQIISDTVCPWCFVGYRRLSRAIRAHQNTHPSDTFTIIWRAFYLNPSAPTFPGMNKQEMYAMKFGPDRAAAIFSRLAAAGEGEGIAFKFGGNIGSTRDSHRLLWYAAEQEAKADQASSASGVIGGLQTRVAELLFTAYFEEEKNITDPAVLIDAAVGAGLDRREVEKLLASDLGGKEVDQEASDASRRLVTGVPYFQVQGKYAIEGADEPETFLEVFERIKAEE